MIKVSVIIPVYGVEKYIERCIGSVISQSADGISVECIIVNDSTPDASMDIVRKMLGNYKGPIDFVILEHEKNKGQSAARNTGIAAATGHYLYFMDSDDRITEDCLKSLSEVVRKDPSIEVATANIYHCKDKTTYMPATGNARILTDQRQLLKDFFDMKLPSSPCNKLIKKDFLTGNRLFFEENLQYEDILWNYQLFMRLHSFAVLPNVTYIYEDNPSSTVNTIGKRVDFTIGCFCRICNYILDNLPTYQKTECFMYTYSVLLKAVDLESNYKCAEKTIEQLAATKHHLLALTFSSRRLLLALFFLSMYKPIKDIFKLKAVRRSYHRISMTVCKTERFFDFLHI